MFVCADKDERFEDAEYRKVTMGFLIKYYL